MIRLYAQVDAIAKIIPKELNITLDGALKESKEFKDLYESDEQIKYLVDMSRRLEGLHVMLQCMRPW